MYKVFVKDRLIFFNEDINRSELIENHLLIKYYCTETLKMAFDAFYKSPSTQKLIVLHDDPAQVFREFSSLFIKSEASGGLVRRETDEAVLMIYKNKHWDLPKGKLEEGEQLQACAIREVQEECGITAPEISGELPSTHHIFSQGNDMILKETKWFSMRSGYTGELRPQAEEGIEKVEWKRGEALDLALEKTYPAIRLLFEKKPG